MLLPSGEPGIEQLFDRRLGAPQGPGFPVRATAPIARADRWRRTARRRRHRRRPAAVGNVASERKSGGRRRCPPHAQTPLRCSRIERAQAGVDVTRGEGEGEEPLGPAVRAPMPTNKNQRSEADVKHQHGRHQKRVAMIRPNQPKAKIPTKIAEGRQNGQGGRAGKRVAKAPQSEHPERSRQTESDG